MLTLSDEQIKNAAEELECGSMVYINLQTKEIVPILDSEDNDFDEDLLEEIPELDPWGKERNEIRKNPDNYMQLHNLSSSESFKAMEQFLSLVEDLELKKKLELGLSLSKPFRNFKDIIGTSDEYEQKWFAFKNDICIEYIKFQIESYNTLTEA